MLWLRVLLSRIGGTTKHAVTQGELSEELRSHLEMLVEEKTSHGISAEEAAQLR